MTLFAPYAQFRFDRGPRNAPGLKAKPWSLDVLAHSHGFHPLETLQMRTSPNTHVKPGCLYQNETERDIRTSRVTFLAPPSARAAPASRAGSAPIVKPRPPVDKPNLAVYDRPRCLPERCGMPSGSGRADYRSIALWKVWLRGAQGSAASGAGAQRSAASGARLGGVEREARLALGSRAVMRAASAPLTLTFTLTPLADPGSGRFDPAGERRPADTPADPVTRSADLGDRHRPRTGRRRGDTGRRGEDAKGTRRDGTKTRREGRLHR